MTEEKRRDRALEQGGFLFFLGLVTAALLVVILPFLQPLLWAALAAIMFQPLYRWFLRRNPHRQNQAASATLLVITVAVILPAVLIGSAVVNEAAGLVVEFQDGEIDAAEWFREVVGVLPANLQQWLQASGWGDFEIFQQRLQELAEDSVGLIAEQAIAFGGSIVGIVLGFGVGLYASFFLLRDGRSIGENILASLPFEREIADRLSAHFLGIVRATIKGSVIVGIAQGALGGLTLWLVGIPSALLLGVIMGIASLLPAVGPAIVWVPVAIYLLATGSIWQGIVVIASGMALVGMVDNLLRPILVGRDTGIPDWMVLVTTLGGLALMGLSGIVVGPLIAGLFLAAWAILREKRGVGPPIPPEGG